MNFHKHTMTKQSNNESDQVFRYEVEGETVEIEPGDFWKVIARSGSGMDTATYRIRSIGPDGVCYTVEFEGNFDHRQRDDPTLFGNDPVEKGTAQYVQTDKQ